MKKRRIIAMIGVLSMCISLVTPVYAEEPQSVSVQSEEEAGKQKIEESPDDTKLEESTESKVDQKTDDTKLEEPTENKVEQKTDDIKAEEPTENADQVENADQAGIAGDVVSDFIVPEDYTGWDDMQEHYYINGQMMAGVYCQIGEDYYAFDTSGCLMLDYHGWLDSFELGYSNMIRTNEQGVLLKNAWHWNEMYARYEYYDNEGCGIFNQVREIEGKLYYFNVDGYLATAQNVVWDGVLYYADENGVLTVVEIDEEKNGWERIGDEWYWYENGEMVRDQIISYNGCEYYLDWNGTMVTSSFWYWDEGRAESYLMLAESNGQIVRSSANRWYYSSEGKYYWFKKADEIASEEFMQIGTAKYYFDYEGVMAVGKFSYQNDKGERIEGIAGSSGAVYDKKSWIYINGEYYYQDDNGLVTNQKKLINGKWYVFDYDGVMQVGLVYHYNDETGDDEYYFTDASGAVKTGGWLQDGPDWYFAGSDGKLVCEDWVGKYYFGHWGNMLTGIQWIEGKKYVFSSSGALIEEIGDFSGWKKYNGIWYFYDAPNVPHEGWLNNTYYIEDGRMLVDRLVWDENNEKYYYVGYNGVKQKGWICSYDTWYYGTDDGSLSIGWKTIGNQKYWFDENGRMAKGIKIIDGEYHQFGESGAWIANLTKDGKEGWIRFNGDWYWWNTDGTYAQGKKTIGGRDYYFYDNGIMRSDDIFWDNENEEWVQVSATGARVDIVNGWISVAGGWYYFEKGKPVDGTKKIGAATYCFSQGEMLKGYEYNDLLRKWCFFSDSGAMQEVTTGWYSLTWYGNKKWYYFQNGKPAEGWKNIGGAWYQFYWDGSMQVGVDDEYVFGASGALVRNGWAYVWDTWYYADSSGRKLRGEQVIGGKTYWFSHEGEWLK